MINKKDFITAVEEKINIARKMQENTKNAVDMRLFIGDDVNSDIYTIDGDGILNLYEKVKNESREWFVDFYENYVEANFAEFLDVALFSNEFPRKKKLYFMSVHKLNDYESHYELSDEEFIKRSEFCYERIEDFCDDFNDESAPSDYVYFCRYC